MWKKRVSWNKWCTSTKFKFDKGHHSVLLYLLSQKHEKQQKSRTRAGVETETKYILKMKNKNITLGRKRKLTAFLFVQSFIIRKKARSSTFVLHHCWPFYVEIAAAEQCGFVAIRKSWDPVSWPSVASVIWMSSQMQIKKLWTQKGVSSDWAEALKCAVRNVSNGRKCT